MSEPTEQWLREFFRRHFNSGPAQQAQVDAWTKVFMKDRERLPDNNPSEEKLQLIDANDALRSCYSVVVRQGVNTRWSALKNRLEQVLVAQSLLLNKTPNLGAAVCTPKTFRMQPLSGEEVQG